MRTLPYTQREIEYRETDRRIAEREYKRRERAAKRAFNRANPVVFDTVRAARMSVQYLDGMTMEQIGKAHGVSRERVRQILERHGTRRRAPSEQPRHRLGHVFNRERAEQMSARYLAGETMAQVGEAFGCSSSTVRNALIELGTPRRSSGQQVYSQEQAEQMSARYLAGETCKQVADAFGVATMTVHRALVVVGTPRRTRAAALKLHYAKAA